MNIPFASKGLLAALLVLLLAAVPFMMAPLAGELVMTGTLTGKDTVTLSGPSGPVTLGVELADTPEEQTRGLMGREELATDEGMLFIFDGDSTRSFWMKDTLIPLDIIFINSSLDIVHIELDAQPCTASCSCQCPRYSSGQPAMYVIEANAGFAREHGIEVGQRVSLNLLQGEPQAL
jgi:uncharacterized membrane protein (UPF0127 family)